ncbi:MAG: PAS domain S-box protein, partial [Paracoccaceae bacterium]
MDNADQINARVDFLSGGGEMAALVSAFDWSHTSLGPLPLWPVEVKSVVAMMMQSPLPIVALFGEVGTMIYNDAYSAFAGSQHPRLLGSEVRKGWPEVADFNDHVIKTVFRAGNTLSFKDQELTLNRGAGPQKAWLNLDYSPLMGGDGHRLGVIAFVVETTDKVKADHKLRDEQVRLQLMYEQSPSFMALLDGPDHRFVVVNEAYQRLIGHRDVLGKTVAEALPEVIWQRYIAHLDKVFASGVAYRSNTAAVDMQAVAGGEIVKRYIDFVYQPIADAAGTITGVFVDGMDVTDRIAAQEAIRASDARFRVFAQVMPNHVWTASPDGLLDWVNQRICDYSGLASEQLMGTAWADIVHPLDRTAAGLRWADAIKKGEPYETEFRIRNASGQYLWHLVRAFPIRDDAGKIVQWVGTNTDIDAQKQAEAETTRDRNRMWALSQDLMLVTDYRGQIIAVNPSGKRMLGWDEEQMVGKFIADFLHPDDVAGAAVNTERLARGATTLAFETRYRCTDGTYRVLDWTAVPDDGHIHGIGRDITEYRRLAKDSERIWNISPVLKVVMDLGGKISNMNPSWTNVLGWTSQETIGHNVLDFVADESRDRSAARLQELQVTNRMMSTESTFMAKDGSVVRIAWTIVPDNGTIYAFGRDITAETKAAAALATSQATLLQAQKMESIGQLTGGVAHDFNNLLQVVSGNLNLLSKEVAGNEKGERRIQNALEAVSGGARLASQLLAIGRRQPLAPKVVNLGRLARNMDEILRRTLGEAVEIETIVAGGLWNTLVDPGNVENALLNLAINGRDAMDGQGNLTVEVGNAYLDDDYVLAAYDVTPGQYVMLSVTDTGMGIAPDLVEKVFEPFFTTKPEGKGTGLGLSMVYGFVKQSNGHVKVYSEVGQGTTIKLYLPRSLHAEDHLVTHDSGPIVGGTETILVAEDDARVRETVIESLTDLGYRVLQASDAQGALAIIESGMQIDLLFTDVVMPGRMKSTELARIAMERLPKLKVLFTSGYTENS